MFVHNRSQAHALCQQHYTLVHWCSILASLLEALLAHQIKKVDIEDRHSSLETKPHYPRMDPIYPCLIPIEKLAEKLKGKYNLFVLVGWGPIFRICSRKWWKV